MRQCVYCLHSCMCLGAAIWHAWGCGVACVSHGCLMHIAKAGDGGLVAAHMRITSVLAGMLVCYESVPAMTSDVVLLCLKSLHRLLAFEFLLMHWVEVRRWADYKNHHSVDAVR